MSKLCMLYNFAPAYREGIFREIDQNWETEWFFGNNDTDINGLNLKILSNASFVKNKKIYGNWYWQKGAAKLTRRKDFSTFFLLGDPYCLSNWLISIKLRLFHPHKRLYFWSHGWYGKESNIVRIIKKAFFRLSDGIFLYGNYARELMIKEGFDPSRLFVIHNSLDYSRQLKLRDSIGASAIYHEHFGNEAPTIIFIGRLTAVKRLDLLIDALAQLKAHGEQYNLALVGDGSERANLERLVAERGIADWVWFYGASYDENLNADLVYNADLCVAPGNVGLTAMHAMVFGTPVISHSDFKWQMPEFEAIREGETGGFFERDNVESLAGAISDWFASNSDRAKIREACFREIDSYWTPDFQMNVLKKNLKVD